MNGDAFGSKHKQSTDSRHSRCSIHFYLNALEVFFHVATDSVNVNQVFFVCVVGEGEGGCKQFINSILFCPVFLFFVIKIILQVKISPFRPLMLPLNQH